MARGWESKGVAEQMEAAAEQRSERRAQPTAGERERRARREGLRLARVRVMRELAAASHQEHRALLIRSLEFLDSELAVDD